MQGRAHARIERCVIVPLRIAFGQLVDKGFKRRLSARHSRIENAKKDEIEASPLRLGHHFCQQARLPYACLATEMNERARLSSGEDYSDLGQFEVSANKGQ